MGMDAHDRRHATPCQGSTSHGGDDKADSPARRRRWGALGALLIAAVALVGVLAPGAAAAGPAFTIEKLQSIEGSKAPYTTSPITGVPGNRVRYQIVIVNTGNAKLALSN